MTVSELRDLLSDYPDETDVVLLDLNDDSEDTGGVYEISESSLDVNELNYKDEDDEPYLMDVLCITFESRLAK